jgi:hypothetical protein
MSVPSEGCQVRIQAASKWQRSDATCQLGGLVVLSGGAFDIRVNLATKLSSFS